MVTTKETNIHQINNDIDKDESDAKIFPQKLMEILSDPANEDAIAWHPNGKVFVIINRQIFSKHVLPKYFRKTKYPSFTRKLNRWNFTRLTRGRQQGMYYHEFFQRGKENLCTQMYCNNNHAKFAVSAKLNNTSSPPPLFPQDKDSEIIALLATSTANTTTSKLQLSQNLSKVCSAPQVISAPLYDLSKQPSLMTTKCSFLPFSRTCARLIEHDLQKRVALLQQQEIQLETELINSQQDELLRKQEDQILLKQKQDHQLLKEYQQQQRTQSLMSQTTAIQLLSQQQALEKEATCLRLQLALMQQQSLPTQHILKCRASAA